MMSIGSWTCKTLIYVFLLYTKEVICGINKPENLRGYVGGNVTFNWTATAGSTIISAKWGLYDFGSSGIAPFFITAEENKTAPSPDLNNVASRYKGRVHFVGNIKQGRAWFMITKLNVKDTNEYGVTIIEGLSIRTYDVKLNVTEPPLTTTAAPPILPSTPVLQLHPKKSVFWQGITIDITCNGVTGNPTLTNLTFLQNGSTIDMLNGITSGNYTEAVLSHALTQPGTFAFSCNATNAAGSSPTSNVVTITVKATTKKTTTGEKCLTTGAIFGIVIAALIVGAILGGLIVYCCIKHKYKKSSGQNCGNSDVALKNKVDKEGNDNTQPTA